MVLCGLSKMHGEVKISVDVLATSIDRRKELECILRKNLVK